MRASCIVIFW